MLNDVFNYKVSTVFISNKDRLTRLSFLTLQNIFKQFGTDIVVTAENKDNGDTNEFFEELISIMHLFSTKEYSNRRNKNNNKENK